MKKLILLIAVVTFIGFSANAQTTSFGLKAGLTAANMKASGGGTSFTYDTKMGFYLGALAEIGISENFAVQPELYYAIMGAKFKGEGSEKLNLNYINLPVLLKYKSQGFSAILGPQIGYLVSAKDKYDGGNDDVKDEFKSTEISALIGAGYTLTNGLGFDARYQLGLSDIIKDNDGEGSLKNNAFIVGLHYFFNR